MKKIQNKKQLALHTETIKTLTEDKLALAAGGRWYESWSLCGTNNGSYETGNVSSGVRA
jgi:hypothetical protein